MITGALSTVKTREGLESTLLLASLGVVAIVVAIRSLNPAGNAHAFAFDLVYIATLFVALPAQARVEVDPGDGYSRSRRASGFSNPAATVGNSDRAVLRAHLRSAIAIGYLATRTAHQLGLDLSEARNAELAAVTDAERARHELQTLRGIIPICSHCHRVRIEDGRLWEAVDMYVSRRTDAGVLARRMPGLSARALSQCAHRVTIRPALSSSRKTGR